MEPRILTSENLHHQKEDKNSHPHPLHPYKQMCREGREGVQPAPTHGRHIGPEPSPRQGSLWTAGGSFPRLLEADRKGAPGDGFCPSLLPKDWRPPSTSLGHPHLQSHLDYSNPTAESTPRTSPTHPATPGYPFPSTSSWHLCSPCPGAGSHPPPILKNL